MEILQLPIDQSSLAHELRLPLTSILNIATLLNKDSLTPAQESYLQDLKNYVREILSFVDKLSLLVQEINITQYDQDEIRPTVSPACPFKVLLVEDTPFLQFVHKKMLENLGYQVALASNAEKALHSVNTDTYDLILMDIGLPDMSGIDAAAKIRQQETIGNKLPIIALTTFSDSKTYHACLDAGINVVAVKPITQKKLQTLIAYYSKRRIVASI
ncbi:MAG: Autoinducer 2 sensor kinase/phosphatase LuxQ [Pseudomonadota bacterium]|jgi:CheY-like chemotaxis protein